MMAITSAPRLYLPSSDASGRFTLMTMSASYDGPDEQAVLRQYLTARHNISISHADPR